MTANLDCRVGVATEDWNGPGEGYNLAFRENWAVDEFATVAGDPDAGCHPLRWRRDLGDEAFERLSGLSEDRPGPDPEQPPSEPTSASLTATDPMSILIACGITASVCKGDCHPYEALQRIVRGLLVKDHCFLPLH